MLEPYFCQLQLFSSPTRVELVAVKCNRPESKVIIFQTNSMRELEMSGEEAAARLLRDVERGEALLGDISRALADIANANLSINRITDASQAQHIRI